MTMTKEQQTLAWACLPKETREEIRKLFNKADTSDNFTAMGVFLKIFGQHNLTSDIEPSELLFMERKKVVEKCNEVTKDYAETGDKWCSGYIDALNDFFGNKCLPDKEPPVQDEPKFKVGDKVRVLGGLANKNMQGKLAFVTKLPKGNSDQFIVMFENGLWTELSEKYLELHTEPETKENMKKLAIDTLIKYNGDIYKVTGCDEYGYKVKVINPSDDKYATHIAYAVPFEVMEENKLGQATCPNCGVERDTTLNPCVCGYNPKTNKVEKKNKEMNTEDFVTYEQAIILKKLGYKEECLFHYGEFLKTNKVSLIDAPTLAQAQKWLRGKRLFLIVDMGQDRNHDSKFAWYANNSNGYIVSDLASEIIYNSYEEALSAGITECLKFLEEQ